MAEDILMLQFADTFWSLYESGADVDGIRATYSLDAAFALLELNDMRRRA